MRVLVVLDYINKNSGVSSVVMNYYHAIDRSKVPMDFLVYEKPEDQVMEELEKQGSHVYVSNHPLKLGYSAYHQFMDHFFGEHQGEYSVVHVHIPNAAFVVLKFAKKYQVPGRILHSHNSKGADGRLKKIRNFLLNKWGIFYANQYFACSESAGAYLFGKKHLDQVCIIRNAIDLTSYEFRQEDRKSMRKKLGIGEDEFVIGHVGRFSEQKNHRFLIEVVKCLKDRPVKFKLLLLGGGELEETVMEQVEKYGLEQQVIFAGVVSNVPEYMDAMDVFVLPSLYEGFPCVCVEAQANGLPCLLSAPVTREVQLCKEVRFLEINDPKPWVEELTKQYQNGSRQNRKKGQECSKLWDYDIMVQAKNVEEKYLSYGNSSDPDVHL